MKVWLSTNAEMCGQCSGARFAYDFGRAVQFSVYKTTSCRLYYTYLQINAKKKKIGDACKSMLRRVSIPAEQYDLGGITLPALIDCPHHRVELMESSKAINLRITEVEAV